MTRSRFSFAFIVLAPLPLAFACGGDATSGPVAERIDSAGVPVVVNPAPDSTSQGWHLSAEPLVEIGVVDGPPELQLFRPSSGAVLADGTIVIANGGTFELRFYDASGAHIRSVGSEGEGPGQFRSIALLGAFGGDSLLVWDQRQRRISVFAGDGTFARSYAGPSELGPGPLTGGALGDGRMVALRRTLGPIAGTTGLQRGVQTIFAVGADGAAQPPIGDFPGHEESIFDQFSMGVVFGRGLHFHARGDRIAIGNDDAFSVRIYGADGGLLQVVRLDRPSVEVREGDFEAAAPPEMPGSPLQARIAGSLAQMPRHTTFPAYEALRLDAAGRLWVHDFPPPGSEGATWHAFAPDGTYLARLDVPPDTTVLEFGEAHVLVRVEDELGVERVRLHRLEMD